MGYNVRTVRYAYQAAIEAAVRATLEADQRSGITPSLADVRLACEASGSGGESGEPSCQAVSQAHSDAWFAYCEARLRVELAQVGLPYGGLPPYWYVSI